ncbi:MAG: hypothetical protein ABI972_11820 [Acidobacteriota bacterium]
MLPTFLLDEGIRHEDGVSAALELSSQPSRVLLLTLGITRIIEQESLDLWICGSEDGVTWSDKPLLAFPQKFYCGAYAMVLDLTAESSIRHIRAHWKMNRWGRGEPSALFTFYLVAEVAQLRPLAAAAGQIPASTPAG